MAVDLTSPEAAHHLMQSNAAHVSPLGTFRILLVEDDALQQAQIATLFEAANARNDGAIRFQLSIAGSAEEAIHLIQQIQFSLILLDMVLPDKKYMCGCIRVVLSGALLPSHGARAASCQGCDFLPPPPFSLRFLHSGFDILPEIREHLGEDISIMMASAHSEIALVQLCMRRGADGFLPKPLDLEDIRHCWQYFKESALPEGSFRADLEHWRNLSHRRYTASAGATSDGTTNTGVSPGDSGHDRVEVLACSPGLTMPGSLPGVGRHPSTGSTSSQGERDYQSALESVGGSGYDSYSYESDGADPKTVCKQQ